MAEFEETKIGDFSRPLAPTRKPEVASPTQEKLEAAEQRLDDKAATAEAVLRPMQSYEDRLKEVGVSREAAASIIDDVLMKGSHSEDIALTPRVKLRLRTRTARDIRRIQEYLEASNPKFENHYQEILSRMSLASSLESFGKDRFEFPSRSETSSTIEQAFANRLSYVESLPDPTLRLLFAKLWKFDQKVRVVLEEGAIENF